MSRYARLSVLHDAENRLRRCWQTFVVAWQDTKPTWRDNRRQQFENEHLRELPNLLNRTQSELSNYRETVQSIIRQLRDEENPS